MQTSSDATSPTPSRPARRSATARDAPEQPERVAHGVAAHLSRSAAMHAARAQTGSRTSSSASHITMSRQPLIDRVTNDWRRGPEYARYTDDEGEDEYGVPLAAKTTRRRRGGVLGVPYLALYVVIALACVYLWTRTAGSSSALNADEGWDDEMGAVAEQVASADARLYAKDVKLIEYLDSRFVPGASHGSKKRLVVVGDVHGCKDELLALLKKLAFNSETDHLVLTGDMLFKGPDSPGVLDLARSLGASCVRGNHEDRVLLALQHHHSSSSSSSSSAPPPSTAITSKDSTDSKHLALGLSLTPAQRNYIHSCPCILHIGPVPPTSPASSHNKKQQKQKNKQTSYLVVHAGLAPGTKLTHQHPWSVMNMRTIDTATQQPSESREGGTPWTALWNHWQLQLLSLDGAASTAGNGRGGGGGSSQTVIYGHDARTGLNLQKFSRGIDSGCVAGGRLTALVLDDRGREKVVSVKCRNYRDAAAAAISVPVDKTVDKTAAS